VWEFTAPASSIFLSSPDTAAHELDGTHTFFPHRLANHTERRDDATLRSWMERTPLADAATLEFAETMVRELSLGADETVDVLAVSLSQTDAIGHGFGPFSREQLDNLYLLDRRLGAVIFAHLHESKALATAGFAILNHFGAAHLAELGKHFLQPGAGDIVAQVTDVQFLTHSSNSKKPNIFDLIRASRSIKKCGHPGKHLGMAIQRERREELAASVTSAPVHFLHLSNQSGRV
jgi:hypothetical protein